MSVRPIGGRELEQVHGNLCYRRRVLEYAGVSEADVAELLRAVHVANRAAWLMTYGDEPDPVDFSLQGEPEHTMTDRELFELLGNMEYNCISNGGKLFLPREQWMALNRLRLTLGGLSLEQADEERKSCREAVR